MSLILASNSRYKRAQMQNLGLSFASIAPECEEQHDTKVTAEQLSLRLANEKAINVQNRHPNSVIIGSDQTAAIEHNQQLLTKPGSKPNAVKQLQMCSGNSVIFYSAVSILTPQTQITWAITTKAVFRTLTEQEITRYIDKENPIDCAGSFKIESLGISLFEKVLSEDPTALVGLPLLSLSNQLRKLNFLVP